MDPQMFHEHYANAQRFARHTQQNEPNVPYLQYAYHNMNQMNNPMGGSGNGGQPMMLMVVNGNEAQGYAQQRNDSREGGE